MAAAVSHGDAQCSMTAHTDCAVSCPNGAWPWNALLQVAAFPRPDDKLRTEQFEAQVGASMWAGRRSCVAATPACAAVLATSSSPAGCDQPRTCQPRYSRAAATAGMR